MPPITQETFTWFFKDPDWKNKFLIGSVFVFLGFVPIIGLIGFWIVYGYALILMRAMMRGETPALSKWENYGKLFLDGFKATLSEIFYYLPGFLLFVAGAVVMFATLFALGLSSPSAKQPSTAYWAFLAGQLVFVLISGIGLLVWTIGVIPTPVAVGQYLRTGKISAGYHLRQVWKILRANLGGYFLAWIMFYAITMGIGVVFSFIYMTIVLCVFLPFVMAPVHLYIQLMRAYLFGSAYREGCLKAGIVLEPSAK